MDLLGSWSAPSGGSGRPFITYYDAATGERTELSGTTALNWVAKTANLLVDDCDAGPGTRVAIALPFHWLRHVWLLATWAVGGTVVDASPDVLLTGPQLEAPGAESTRFRFASALLPFGARFAAPIDGFVDLGEVLPGQPDAFFPLENESDQDVAVDLAGRRASFAELVTSADASSGRLTWADGSLNRDIDAVVAAARGGGSMVLVTNASGPELERIAAQEHAQLA